MKEWCLIYNDYDPKKEGLREALCVLGNGYFAVRGAGEETQADDIHYPGCYLAGGYNRLTSQINGHQIENEDLVNFPNWLSLKFRIGGGAWFSLDRVKIVSYQQVLNVQSGVLTRDIHFIDNEDLETKISVRRIVSMHDPHLAAIQMLITPVNWDDEIEIRSALDGMVVNDNVKRYHHLNHQHLEKVEAYHFEDNAIYLQVKTNQSHIHMAQAARTTVWVDDQQVSSMVCGDYTEEKHIAKYFKFSVRKQQTICIEKVVAIYTSRDKAISECGLEARNTVRQADCFNGLFEKHKMEWKHLWNRFDISLKISAVNGHISQVLRLHFFHLLQTTSIHSLEMDIGVPARGWHGEAYRGHVFWDELFVFPILSLQVPEITRSLLLYRYRRLRVAKCAAKEANLAGALYPWQSGSNGREESQKIHLNPRSGRWVVDNSNLQRHVSAAIAYNIWQHFEVTGDVEFLTFYGAEMLLEIARFWASLATFNCESGRYDILGVMGPDEYHDSYPDAKKPGLNNNAYTNVLVSWVFARALEVLSVIPQDRRQELEEMLNLNREELNQWDTIRKKLFVPFHQDGVISQFAGYENLLELDWKSYQKKYSDLERLDRILEAEGDSVNRYKVSKQADVLMLFYLFSTNELCQLFKELGYQLDNKIIRKTIKYYMQRTSHGSTLSRIVHSWTLARSNREASWKLFTEALKSDIDDTQGGTTPEGVHLGAMAGTIDLLQRCYTGLEFRKNVLRFNPQLPQELQQMTTEIRYRGHSLWLKLTHEKLCVVSLKAAAEPIHIACCECQRELKKGEEFEINLKTMGKH